MDTPRKKKRSTIQIDGDKLRSLLESTTGKTIYEISIENGFSKNLISEACRSGYASAVVQNVTKLYGISPEAYKIVETEDKKPSQISIDDIEALKREELKTLIKEVFNDIIFNCEIVIQSDKVKGSRLFLQERGAYKNMEV